MRLVGWVALVCVVAGCGATRQSATDVPPDSDQGGSAGTGDHGGGGATNGGTGAVATGGGGASGGGMSGGGTSAAAVVPLVPGEYWVRTEGQGDPVHIRIVSPTEAVVGGTPYAIERESAALGTSSAIGGGPAVALHGPVVLRSPFKDSGLVAVAVTAGPGGTLGDEALLLGGNSTSIGCLHGGQLRGPPLRGPSSPT